jgi:Protein of unknown function (DUF4012)
VRRRLLILLLFGLLVAGGAATAWQARGQARLVQGDLTTARSLLASAGGFQVDRLEQRLDLIERAEAHTVAAQHRLDRWPLRQLGALPLIGRDVRVVRAVAASATGTARATSSVVTALEPLQHGAPTRSSLLKASNGLLALKGALDRDLERVRAARPLITGAARQDYLKTAESASRTAQRGGQGLKLAASLYGPPGTARWFLALQNPAELRGTGGLIGQYGILESSLSGPRLTTVASYGRLNARTKEGVPLPDPIARRYERFAINQAWSSVNIPPDLPTVGRIVTRLYEQATGDRIDGVVAVDPLVIAEVLRVSGPIEVDGIRLMADNVAEETLVQAYVRYQQDNEARRDFLGLVAKATFRAFVEALGRDPFTLLRGLGSAARGRHVQIYSTDPGGQKAIMSLGLGGSATAPQTGDYLMPVGINAAGNKLDAFTRRTLDWRVRLAPDGSARAQASLTLRNTVPPTGMPRYIVGPFDKRFRAGVNEQIQTLYVASGYGFTGTRQNGRPVGAEAQADMGGLALTQAVEVPAGRSTTIDYRLTRPNAAIRLADDHLRYRVLLRPQATVQPDRARVVVEAPPGWRFSALPTSARLKGGTARWSGPLDKERQLDFELLRN